MIIFKKIDDFYRSIDQLGFVERYTFKIASIKENTNVTLLDVLESDIFHQGLKSIHLAVPQVQESTVKFNHILTDKIEVNDFIKITFDELIARIEDIKQDDDWGVDLPIFITLMNESIDWIKENRYNNESFYFIFNEQLSPEKIDKFPIYSYFISIVIISVTTSKVVIINHGGD